MRLLCIPSPFLLAAAAACLTSGARAQHVVDYDTSTLANPPAYGFPLYTPGAGSTGATVRAQWLCPDAFLSQQNLSSGFVTHIGLSLAGQATYSTFELRAGTTTASSLATSWNANLPDQRVQVDRSNVALAGGGSNAAPINQWVEFELAHPFHYEPGDHIVVDLTAAIAVPGVMLGTTVGTSIPRAYEINYTGQPDASQVQQGGGLLFRLRIAPQELLSFGQGCPGTGNFVPQLTAMGQSSLGSTNHFLLADQALPNTFAGFVVGFSRTAFVGGPLPLSYGNGCELLVSPDTTVTVVTQGTTAGTGTAAMPLFVPNWPALRGVALHAQFVQLDLQSAASQPVAFSNAGTVVLF